jgi:hypothetical protein
MADEKASVSREDYLKAIWEILQVCVPALSQ